MIVATDGMEVGKITSGCLSPMDGKRIALAYVPSELSGIGTKVEVGQKDRYHPAVVVETPFYKRPE
jgi:aminomethyltransferase